MYERCSIGIGVEHCLTCSENGTAQRSYGTTLRYISQEHCGKMLRPNRFILTVPSATRLAERKMPFSACWQTVARFGDFLRGCYRDSPLLMPYLYLRCKLIDTQGSRRIVPSHGLTGTLADSAELPDFQRITGSRPTPEEFCLKLAYGCRPLQWSRIPMPDIQRNFQLRTLWVVTLCSLRADDSFA
jgi:hypothetical protein